MFYVSHVISGEEREPAETMIEWRCEGTAMLLGESFLVGC
jgi:hypothetical protein